MGWVLNANDALVWKALICKYFCKNRIETFSRDDFYEIFLAGRLEAGDASIPPLKNGSNEDRKLFEKKEWVLRWNEVKKIKPSIEYFDNLINRSSKRVRDTGIKPLKFDETLKYKNQKLYDLLVQQFLKHLTNNT